MAVWTEGVRPCEDRIGVKQTRVRDRNTRSHQEVEDGTNILPPPKKSKLWTFPLTVLLPPRTVGRNICET